MNLLEQNTTGFWYAGIRSQNFIDFEKYLRDYHPLVCTLVNVREGSTYITAAVPESRVITMSGSTPQRTSSLKTSPGISMLTQALVKDLYTLFKDDSSCDLVFLVGVREERVPAHKLIVLARCENYKQKKEEWLMTATRMIQVKLGKHSKDTVKKVVKYLYTGEVVKPFIADNVIIPFMAMYLLQDGSLVHWA